MEHKRIVIADSDKELCENLKSELQEYAQLEVVGSVQSGEAAALDVQYFTMKRERK